MTFHPPPIKPGRKYYGSDLEEILWLDGGDTILEAMYPDVNCRIRDIADKLGVDPYAVHARAQWLKIERPPRMCKADQIRDKVAAMVHDHSDQKIADVLGVNRSTVSKCIRRHNLVRGPRRQSSEPATERNNQICALFRAGVPPAQIMRRLKLTRNTVSGVLYRRRRTDTGLASRKTPRI